MPDTVYYCIDGVNNKVETLSKEQILDAIEQAIEGGSVLAYDDAFVTQIKEINKDRALKVWIGTQAEYNAISEKQDYVLYIISDDQQKEDIIEYIEQLHEDSDSKIEAEAEARADADAALQQNINDEAAARASADSLLNSAVGNVSKRTELYFICETPTATADKICVLQDSGTIPTITLGTRIVVQFKNPCFISDTSTAFPTLTLQDANGNRLYNSALYIDGGVGAGRVNCKQKVWAQDGVVRFVLGKVSGVSANRWIMQADYRAQTAAAAAQTAVTEEASARASADTTLQGNITAEATARQTADNTLQNNITAEATARANADSTLQTSVANVAKRTELFFTCDTASSTAAKVAVLQDSGSIQTIAVGTRIVVKFANESKISDSSTTFITLQLKDSNNNEIFAAKNIDAGNGKGRIWGKSEVWSKDSVVSFVYGSANNLDVWIMECDYNAQTAAKAVADSITDRFGAASTKTTVSTTTHKVLWEYSPTGAKLGKTGDAVSLTDAYTDFDYLIFCFNNNTNDGYYPSVKVCEAKQYINFMMDVFYADTTRVQETKQLFFFSLNDKTITVDQFITYFGVYSSPYSNVNGNVGAGSDDSLIQKIVGVKVGNAKIPVKTVT
jgi:hypothetical protein